MSINETDDIPEPSRMAHRIKVFVGLAVVIGALGFLVYTAFQSASVYFYTVSEIKEIGPTDEGRLVKVNGKLVQGSFVREDASTIARFTLVDTERPDTLSAVHDGVIPTDLFFNEHSEIILEGSYGDDGVFYSESILVKCPSKYVAAS